MTGIQLINTNFLERKNKREEEQEKKEVKMRKVKKFALIGAASVGGGVLVGLTGGLVAPLVGASLAALLGRVTKFPMWRWATRKTS